MSVIDCNIQVFALKNDRLNFSTFDKFLKL